MSEGYARVIGSVDGGLELKPTHPNGSDRGDAHFHIFFPTENPNMYSPGDFYIYSRGQFEIPTREFLEGEKVSMSVRSLKFHMGAQGTTSA